MGGRVKPVSSQWEVTRKGSMEEPVEDSETMWELQDNLDGSIKTATEREVVTAGEATRLNQALVLRCSLVALQDSHRLFQYCN